MRLSAAVKSERGAQCKLPIYKSICLAIFILCLFVGLTAAQQNDGDYDDRPSTRSAKNPSTTSTSSVADPTQSPVALTESLAMQATLDLNSSSPAQFFLAAPFRNMSGSFYVTAALCSGPGIPPYDVDNSTLLSELKMDYWQALTATVPTMYVSTDADNTSPGPTNTKGSPDVAHFFGGFAQSQSKSQQDDGAWIAIYPPKDSRNVTGAWDLFIIASSEENPIAMRSEQGLTFADSDRTNALLSTYNASQGLSPNLSLAILPTYGLDSLQDSSYFNSSICAISNAFESINSTRNDRRPLYNRTETMRGSIFDNTTRVQWGVSNLQPNTNYTAWLFDVGSLGFGGVAMSTTTMWPAIKFTTKQSDTCRLVYDVDFCPSVAYSIPVGPDVPTERALSLINDTIVSPNFANFSATLDTFPCDSSDFGRYSPLQSCSSCRRAYQDWLCAVTMPRCTDPLPTVSNQTTAAIPDPFDLLGIETPLNTQLLPYVINRQNSSRQPYIEDENGLDAGSYGELLPCIYTCYAVASSCPQPLIQWTCPLWDITAQSQYGTFADAGEGGLGGGQNGGTGSDGQRWGGLTRFIAQDNFGNVYCNSMNVERRLLITNSAMSSLRSRPYASSSFTSWFSTLFACLILLPFSF